MISFMVLSAPRSGSTWASNWLTTGGQVCLHDPVLDIAVEHLDNLPYIRRYGLACTALPLLTDWCNSHPAPKVILHRELEDVNASLERIGLSALPAKHWDGLLDRLAGCHVYYRDLFRPPTARAIWEHLCPWEPFDPTRHSFLSAMHIDPHFPRVRVNHDRTREFRDHLRKALA
jgi:hypothetical protein